MMSHFTVLVIGPNVEGQLARFDENLAVEPYPRYWSEEDMKSFREHYHVDDMAKATPEQMKNWNGVTDFGWDATGFYSMTAHNPDSKWDWKLLGGRWRGFFKLIEGGEGKLGKPGAFGNEPPLDGKRADQVLKKYVDFKGMADKDERDAAVKFDKVRKIVEHLPTPISWEACREVHVEIDNARDYYHAQPAIKALKEAKIDSMFGPDPVGYYMLGQDPVTSRAKFIHRAGVHSVMSYAVVKDGQWYSSSDMGWFGVSSDEIMSETEWEEAFYKLIADADDSDLFSIIDCHI